MDRREGRGDRDIVERRAEKRGIVGFFCEAGRRRRRRRGDSIMRGSNKSVRGRGGSQGRKAIDGWMDEDRARL